MALLGLFRVQSWTTLVLSIGGQIDIRRRLPARIFDLMKMQTCLK